MKNVVIGLVGTALDMRGKRSNRKSKWRPSISVCQQSNFQVDRFELLHDRDHNRLAHQIAGDIKETSPNTRVKLHTHEVDNPWDFEAMYSALLDFSLTYPFKPEEENYFLHITTGTHVAQICWFLLCEARYIPAKILQSSPTTKDGPQGRIQTIDLDLSKYDKLSSRFERQQFDNISLLKSGIETQNPAFNAMIDQIEYVAIRSDAPILITGPTGAGKSQIAKRIYKLKKDHGLLQGEFVNVNCATLRGDNAMSTLFGHTKGAFTGAQNARQGLLSRANGGLLFLDEIGELGADEQAMLLHALEEKCFYPVGSDKTVDSHFQLIAGTNRQLQKRIKEGLFRDDLFARINLWSYRLLGLVERREDIVPNLDYELQQLEHKLNHKVSINKSARSHYLKFALSNEAIWQGNFRDLNASVVRMVTLAEGGRINEAIVHDEIKRLQLLWQSEQPSSTSVSLSDFIPNSALNNIDLFDQQQLSCVIETCQHCHTLSEAGRQLYNRSRELKSSTNDGHRLRQYLAKFNLTFDQLK